MIAVREEVGLHPGRRDWDLEGGHVMGHEEEEEVAAERVAGRKGRGEIASLGGSIEGVNGGKETEGEKFWTRAS